MFYNGIVVQMCKEWADFIVHVLETVAMVTMCPNPGSRSRTPSVGSPRCDGSELRLSERVLVVGQRTGVVRFSGKTNFAPGGGDAASLLKCRNLAP